jgi:DNA-binding protein HU-beta
MSKEKETSNMAEKVLKYKELVEKLAEEQGLKKTQAKAILDFCLSEVKACVEKGETVDIPGFGKLKVAERSARTGRNPATGETIEIPASKKIKFAPAKALKDLIK